MVDEFRLSSIHWRAGGINGTVKAGWPVELQGSGWGGTSGCYGVGGYWACEPLEAGVTLSASQTDTDKLAYPTYRTRHGQIATPRP
ncbi:hypothetical protein NG798_24595 [Ancylothrix sp. C2]|uniref:hypothetical protein n=1 Tax=Ancylothrix sp. D3o TaxID=2953691 RepID=UPI0021BAA38C|nr:hypothetical protein [Ancylothrix sp. D3o]MCT7952982.1 hypothetical protein [Ancylothrix sp. D3o]